MTKTFNGPIERKSFSFALEIVKAYKKVINNHKEFVLSKQMLRSGTAVGALSREAQNAESKRDFIHKLHIAQKECDETIYWILLMHETEFLKDDDAKKLFENANELLKMIRSAVITAKKRL